MSVDPAVIETLRHSPLFALADDAALERCATFLTERRFRRGETIFHQGDAGDSLHLIQSGAVKIVLPSPEGEEAAIIATLGPGEFFGELSLLDGGERSATAIAQDATVTRVLRRDSFLRLFEEDPALRRALLVGIVGELRLLTHHVAELHFLDLPGRLARRIVRLVRQVEPTATGEVRIPWPYSQGELASMIGGTRQSVNRLLADLAATGLIRLEREALLVPDLERLERAADR